jgi:hypothetical protein
MLSLAALAVRKCLLNAFSRTPPGLAGRRFLIRALARFYANATKAGCPRRVFPDHGGTTLVILGGILAVSTTGQPLA